MAILVFQKALKLDERDEVIDQHPHYLRHGLVSRQQQEVRHAIGFGLGQGTGDGGHSGLEAHREEDHTLIGVGAGHVDCIPR